MSIDSKNQAYPKRFGIIHDIQKNEQQVLNVTLKKLRKSTAGLTRGHMLPLVVYAVTCPSASPTQILRMKVYQSPWAQGCRYAGFFAPLKHLEYYQIYIRYTVTAQQI